jgi:hypothetical protein
MNAAILLSRAPVSYDRATHLRAHFNEIITATHIGIMCSDMLRDNGLLRLVDIRRSGARKYLSQLVGAENAVTLCDLRIFVDQATEPVPAQNAHTGHFDRRMRASGG